MNKVLLVLSLSFISLQGFAFSLLYTNPPRYKGAVEILVVNQNCNNIVPEDLGRAYTVEDLHSDVSAAVAHFWNKNHSSSLRFVVRPEPFDMAGNLLLSEMLSATPSYKIVIGCSSNSTQFSSTGILAGTRMSNADPAKAVVGVNNVSGSAFATLTQEQRIATLAHEIGHGLGLGHTSHRDALMYYAATDDVKVKYLSPDDADGATYLYPKKSKFLGLVGGCGLIKDVSKGDGEGMGLLIEAVSLIFFYLLWRKISFKRSAKAMLSR
jgi:hypothetical protein